MCCSRYKYGKAFIKPFDAPQRSVKFIFSLGQGSGREALRRKQFSSISKL